MEKHVLNERLKRIEPVETLCQFCNRKHSEDMNSNYFVPLFRVEDRTYLVVYSSVKFKKIFIGIPRCSDCKKVHNDTNIYPWAISFIAGLFFIILSFFFLGLLYGLYSMVIILTIAIITPLILVDRILKKKGVLRRKEAVKKDALVQDLVINGWSLTQPSPR